MQIESTYNIIRAVGAIRAYHKAISPQRSISR